MSRSRREPVGLTGPIPYSVLNVGRVWRGLQGFGRNPAHNFRVSGAGRRREGAPITNVKGLLHNWETVDNQRGMANEIEIAGRKFWIVSEPDAKGWRASVLEVVEDQADATLDLGIKAIGETRSAADEAALGQLQRRLRTLQ